MDREDQGMCGQLAFLVVVFFRLLYFRRKNKINMSIKEIADRLVALCRQSQWKQAQRELFTEDAVSMEPYPTPAFEKETKGLTAIQEKADRWDSMVQETHAIEVSEPMVADRCFAVTMRMDVTMKDGKRFDFTELCVYQVKDGKITSEQFF